MTPLRRSLQSRDAFDPNRCRRLCDMTTMCIKRELRILHPDHNGDTSSSVSIDERIRTLTNELTRRRPRLSEGNGKRSVHRFAAVHREVCNTVHERLRLGRQTIRDLRAKPSTPDIEATCNELSRREDEKLNYMKSLPPPCGLLTAFVPRQRMLSDGVNVALPKDGLRLKLSGVQLNAYFDKKVRIGDPIRIGTVIERRCDLPGSFIVSKFSALNNIITECGQNFTMQEVRNVAAGRWNIAGARRIQAEYIKWLGMKKEERLSWIVSDCHFSRYVSAAQVKSFTKHLSIDKLFLEVQDSIKANLCISRRKKTQSHFSSNSASSSCPW